MGSAHNVWARLLRLYHPDATEPWHEELWKNRRGKPWMVGINFGWATALANSFQFPNIRGSFSCATCTEEIWVYCPSPKGPGTQFLPTIGWGSRKIRIIKFRQFGFIKVRTLTFGLLNEFHRSPKVSMKRVLKHEINMKWMFKYVGQNSDHISWQCTYLAHTLNTTAN